MINIATCIYQTNLKKMGGRSGRLPRYCGGLNVIAKNCPEISIYCFTDENTLNQIMIAHPYLLENDNIKFVLDDLKDNDYHEKIVQLKNNPHKIQNHNPIALKNRCYEMMFQKMNWMSRIRNDYVFWIDAGFLHPDVLSPKNASNRYDKSINNYLDKSLINTPKLESIIEKGCSLFFYHNYPNNRDYELEQGKFSYFEGPSVIGGFFCLCYKDRDLINQFNEEAMNLLNHDVLVTEESILANLLRNRNDVLKLYFDYMGVHKKNHEQVISLENLIEGL